MSGTNIAVGTASLWSGVSTIPPKGLICYESDTNHLRIGDGSSAYSALPLVVDHVFTAGFAALLSTFNQANSLVKLGSDGYIPSNLINLNLQGSSLQFVANWAALNAIPTSNRGGMVYVVDATGDTNEAISAGGAWYAWNTNHSPNVWQLVSDQQLLNLNVSNVLEVGASLDNLSDSANYVRMTPAERTKLASVSSLVGPVVLQGVSASPWA